MPTWHISWVTRVRFTGHREALQEYIRRHEDEQRRTAAIEDGLALLTSGAARHLIEATEGGSAAAVGPHDK